MRIGKRVASPQHSRKKMESVAVHPYCGSAWQGAYSRVHAAARAANPPRLLRVQTQHGLGNSMDAVITLFLVALLSNRALVIPSLAGAPPQTVFDSPQGVDWTWNPEWDALPTKNVDLDGLDSGILWGDAPDARWLFDALSQQNLTEIVKQPVFAVGLGAPAFDLLFENKFHRQQLFDWGLSPSLVFGCALNFLFEPNFRLVQRFPDQFQLMSDPSVMKIGIHARYGDEVFTEPNDGGHAFDEDTCAYIFDCARAIESRWALPGQRTLWFVISDSQGLRRFAKKRFGPTKVISNSEIPVRHTDFISGDDAEGFALAVAEYWLFSLANYHILKQHSSYSNGAASASLWWSSTVILERLKSNGSCLEGLHRAHEHVED
jgi:hypothetical protein